MFKKKKYLVLSIFFCFHAQVFAGDAGILNGIGSGAVEKIRSGDIHADDIPKIIQGAIDYLMGFSATVAIIFIIIGAYKVLWHGTDEKHIVGKETVVKALGGFAFASLARLILKFIIDNLTM